VGLTIASGQPATAADVLAAVANAGTPIITNISALRALTASTTATSVFVSGYYTVADGGGGLFVRNTTDTSSTDNGGTRIIDAAGRRWFRVVLDTVSVLMFGAKGDGVADDAPAFRAAITANVAPVIVPGYGRIYLFNSTIASPYPYFLPAGVLISNINGFRLIGQGAPIIAMGNSAAGAEHFIINRCNDFYVSGLVHQGNRSNLASSVENPGYAVHSCQNFVFERLHFTGNWGGEGSMFCGDWLINGTWREINGDAVGIGFDMAFLQDCLFPASMTCLARTMMARGRPSATPSALPWKIAVPKTLISAPTLPPVQISRCKAAGSSATPASVLRAALALWFRTRQAGRSRRLDSPSSVSRF
jgi:hypothetical protein